MKWTIHSIVIMGFLFCDLIALEKKPPPQVTPPTTQASPEEAEDANLFRPNDQVYSTHVEFLYWKTCTTDLIIGQTMTEPSWNSNGSPALAGAMGNYKTAQFNIDPGFRIAQSFFRASRFWEMWGSYTRLTSRGKNSSSAPTPQSNPIISGWPLPLMTTLTEINSSLHYNYNVVDVFINRYFNPNPHLRVRLIAGLTGTWQNMDWRMKFFDILDQHAKIRSDWSYWGCGLRFGLTGDWFWSHDIYLTLRATLAGLMGPYHNKILQTTNATSPEVLVNNTLPVRKASYRDTRPAGNLQLLLGPSWQRNWSRSRTELFVGYEFNAWMNLHEVYHSTMVTAGLPVETWINSGWIGLQGFNARFTIDY